MYLDKEAADLEGETDDTNFDNQFEQIFAQKQKELKLNAMKDFSQVI